jgi:phage terminase large subunit-like protein
VNALTTAQLAQLGELQLERIDVERSLYGGSFRDFIKAAWPHIESDPFIEGAWHIDAICDHLQAQSNGDIQRLIISVPPGSGKSFCAGVMWTAWEWARKPHITTLATAMDEALARRDNGRARRLIQSPWYQRLFPTRLEQDSNSVLKFTNDQFGFRQSCVMSGLTGNRAHRIIIDDAISASNAQRDQMRQNVNDTFWLNAPSRMKRGGQGSMTVIQQRLHMDDLVGNIIETEGDRWEQLVIPMEYVPRTFVSKIGWSDPRKEAGELMFPALWDADDCAAERRKDAYIYSSQYQQNPVPDGNRFFDEAMIHRYKPADRPAALTRYMTSDHAKGTAQGDYSVFRIWGVDEHKNFWLLASHRTRDPFSEALGIGTDPQGKLVALDTGALALINRHKPVKWFAEQDNIMGAQLSMLRATMRSANIHCPIVEVKHGGLNKQDRARPYQAAINLGKVYLPEGTTGDDALAEYATFPVGKHDDQIDADAILPRLIDETWAAIVPPAPQKKTRDAYQNYEDNGGRSENWGMFF